MRNLDSQRPHDLPRQQTSSLNPSTLNPRKCTSVDIRPPTLTALPACLDPVLLLLDQSSQGYSRKHLVKLAGKFLNAFLKSFPPSIPFFCLKIWMSVHMVYQKVAVNITYCNGEKGILMNSQLTMKNDSLFIHYN